MKTMNEVAEMFHVHLHTVRNWISQGKIKAVKIGRAVRIPDEEVDKLRHTYKEV